MLFRSEKLPEGITSEQRRQWAHEALVMTASYDLALASDRGDALHYGENPHQRGFLLRASAKSGVAGAEIIQGKAMSLNNYADLNIAWTIAQDNLHSAVVIKHGIPSGVAISAVPVDSYLKALASDPISAFGGVIALSVEVDSQVAEAILGRFTEVVAAPSFTTEALSVFARKPNIRIVRIKDSLTSSSHVMSINGGYLVQERDSFDNNLDDARSWKRVAGNNSSPSELLDLEFAWKVAAR